MDGWCINPEQLRWLWQKNTQRAFTLAFWSKMLASRWGIPWKKGLLKGGNQTAWSRIWRPNKFVCPCKHKSNMVSAKLPRLASSAEPSLNSARWAALSKHPSSSTARIFWTISGFALPRVSFTQVSKPCTAGLHNTSHFLRDCNRSSDCDSNHHVLNCRTKPGLFPRLGLAANWKRLAQSSREQGRKKSRVKTHPSRKR